MRGHGYTELTRAGVNLVCGLSSPEGCVPPHPTAELAGRTLCSVPVVGVLSSESFLGRKQPSEFSG